MIVFILYHDAIKIKETIKIVTIYGTIHCYRSNDCSIYEVTDISEASQYSKRKQV